MKSVMKERFHMKKCAVAVAAAVITAAAVCLFLLCRSKKAKADTENAQ